MNQQNILRIFSILGLAYNFLDNNCCIGRDGTRFDSECAFIYSDIMVIISQVTPVTIQNKNHLEIIQIITFK